MLAKTSWKVWPKFEPASTVRASVVTSIPSSQDHRGRPARRISERALMTANRKRRCLSVLSVLAAGLRKDVWFRWRCPSTRRCIHPQRECGDTWIGQPRVPRRFLRASEPFVGSQSNNRHHIRSGPRTAACGRRSSPAIPRTKIFADLRSPLRCPGVHGAARCKWNIGVCNHFRGCSLEACLGRGPSPAGSPLAEGVAEVLSAYGHRWPTMMSRLSPECRAPSAVEPTWSDHDRSPARFRLA